MSLGIKNLTRAVTPRLPYTAVVNRVFGKDSTLAGPSGRPEVSLTFVSQTRSRMLNRIYRGKDRPTNILTFPFAPSEGEILICLSTARAEARRTRVSFSKYLQRLFIHGLLHLKGFVHGSRMEKLELWVEQSLLD